VSRAKTVGEEGREIEPGLGHGATESWKET